MLFSYKTAEMIEGASELKDGLFETRQKPGPVYWAKISLTSASGDHTVNAYAAIHGFPAAKSQERSREEQLSEAFNDAQIRVMHPKLLKNLAKISCSEAHPLQGAEHLEIEYLSPEEGSRYKLDVKRNRPVQ